MSTSPSLFDLWAKDVDRLCRRHLSTPWAELSQDQSPLRIAFEAGSPPEGICPRVGRRPRAAVE